MKRALLLGLAASAAWFISQGSVQATDTVRLGGSVNADTQTLGFGGDVNTELTAGRGGWHGGSWGGRGWGGGHWGGRGWGGWGGRAWAGSWGHRGWGGWNNSWGWRGWNVGWRGWGGWGGWRTSWGYWGAPRVWSGYWGGYSPYFYSYPTYYYPCADDTLTTEPAVVLGSNGWNGSNGYGQTTPYQRPATQMLPQDDPNQTFFYDGGPVNPSGAAPLPAKQPAKPPQPRDGRLVSLPANSTSGVTYPAYGENARPPTSSVPAPTRLVSYPAYGDQPAATPSPTVVTRAR